MSKDEETRPIESISYRNQNGKFRLDTNQFFVTFPQCSTDPEKVATRLQRAYGTKIEWALIARERHRDGALHLHVALKLTNRITIRSPGHFDKFTGKHGNVQRMRNSADSIRYLHKEDPSPVVIGVLPSPDEKKKKQPKITDTIAQMVLDGKDFTEIIELAPGFAMMNMTKIQNFSVLATTRTRMSMLPTPTKLITDWALLGNTYNGDPKPRNISWTLPSYVVIGMTAIVNWVNSKLLTGHNVHDRQLWIVGAPGIGKTSFLELLSERINTHWQAQEAWFDGLSPSTQMILFDEFDGKHITRATLCNVLDGIKDTRLKVRNGQYVFTRPLPVVVSSNLAPNEIWGVDTVDFKAVMRRLTFVNLRGDDSGNVTTGDFKIGPPTLLWKSHSPPDSEVEDT